MQIDPLLTFEGRLFTPQYITTYFAQFNSKINSNPPPMSTNTVVKYTWTCPGQQHVQEWIATVKISTNNKQWIYLFCT
jgi:hypothetical protein